jgi:ubiquinone/menaquinone biosynthesis C-methylase UbiE
MTIASDHEQRSDNLPDYAPLLQAFHAEFGEELRSMIAKLPLRSGHRVLEVATGDGQFAVWLKERVGLEGSVTAVDISAAWLREAQKQVAAADREVQLELADARRLPYPDGAFDFVWCAQSLYSLPDIHACMNEMRRVLRPGGHVAIMENDSVHHILLPWPVDLEIQILAAELKAFQRTASQPAKFYAGRWLSRLLRSIGLKRPQERSFAYTRQQPLTPTGQQYFASYLRSLRQRVGSFLSDRALRRFDCLVDETSRRSFWNQPDFVAVCIDRVVWATR